jgi:hypothetical protein
MITDFDDAEIEKYKHGSAISVEFGSKFQLIGDLSRRSTVFEVVQRLLKDLSLNDGKWVLVETWRGVERPLPPRTRILRVWHSWCAEQRHVKFTLRAANDTSYRYHCTAKKRRRPIIKGNSRL